MGGRALLPHTEMPLFWLSRTEAEELRGGGKELLATVTALKTAQDSLASEIRLLKNEWEDVLDRTNRVMGRLNARIKKSEAVSEPENETQAPQGAEVSGKHAVLAAMRGGARVLPR